MEKYSSPSTGNPSDQWWSIKSCFLCWSASRKQTKGSRASKHFAETVWRTECWSCSAVPTDHRDCSLHHAGREKLGTQAVWSVSWRTAGGVHSRTSSYGIRDEIARVQRSCCTKCCSCSQFRGSCEQGAFLASRHAQVCWCMITGERKIGHLI